MLDSLFKPKKALPLVIGVALILRLIPLRFKYLLGCDPYFHLAYIEEALKAGEWFNFFTIANGPWGFQIKTFHPLGLWMTPAYVYKVLKFFGVSLYNAFRVTPVIFGVLTIAFFYLALLKFYDEKRAFFASLFLAVSFGHIFRSMANYYRGDNYMLFWYSVALLGVAYAFSMDRRLGYKRFVFYLVPAFASGLASIFWQAYYPIFVFLLANAVFLAVGAFLMDEKKLLDSLLLALSTLLGAFIANSLGEKFGYGMLRYNDWLGKEVAEKLALEFGTIKDAYLLVHVKYLVPLALAFIVLLFFAGRFVKDIKIRAGILVGFAFLGVLVLFYRFEALNELSTGFGVFKEYPILETRPSTFNDLWNAFALGIFIALFFFLKFRPKSVEIQDFMLLGLIVPSLYMIKTWTRFLFIGSMGIALMAGFGLWELHELLKPKLKGKRSLAISLALLLLIPSANGFVTLDMVWKEKPLMNENWERALTWFKENSNENDIVLAWWDYGTWVTYYARRAPVAEIAPNPSVALYFLGKLDENWAMGLGVDYVIVSYYDFRKFGAVVDTAKMGGYNITEEYGLVILPMVSSLGAFVFQRDNYRVIVKPDDRWSVVVNVGGRTLTPEEVYVEYKREVIKPELPSSNSNAYLYINLNYKYVILMNEETFNTTLAKLFIKPEEPYELVYSDGGIVKVLKLKHPNVKIERKKNEIVFSFDNATGTKLKIWGLLDNGTIVFEKEYAVENRTEFKLPQEVKGEIIRYAYLGGGKVIDRGIFRRD